MICTLVSLLLCLPCNFYSDFTHTSNKTRYSTETVELLIFQGYLNIIHKIFFILLMDVIYTWILRQGINCLQFSLLTWTSFIGQFVHPVGREGGIGYRDEGDSHFRPLQVSLNYST